ncbi:MAG: PIN domain-containing protein [Pirellulaceae bacterium]
MKFTDALRGYVSYSDSLVGDIWAKAEFCLDTNVLLNVYRYSQESSVAFLKVLGAIKGRLFVPHRVALEFARNRVQVIRGHYEPHRLLRTELDKIQMSIDEKFKRHPDITKLVNVIQVARKAVDEAFGIAEKTQMELIKNDTMLRQVLDIIGDEIGEPYPQVELDQEYKRRKDKHIPPFCKMDDDKDEEQRTGDVAIWLELLKRFEGKAKPLVFVTADMKENWWQDVGGGRHVPQPLLVQEMYDRTKSDVLFYTADRFNEVAPAKLGVEAPDLAAETRQIQEREKERQAERRKRLASYLAKGNALRGITREQLELLEKGVVTVEVEKIAKLVSGLSDDEKARLFEQARRVPEETMRVDIERLLRRIRRATGEK